MAWNHDADRQAREHFQRCPGGGHGLRIDFLRHDKPVTVFPQRVAGNEYPVLGIEKHQRAHVMARCGQRAPFEVTPDACVSRRDDLVAGKAICALIAVVEQQRLLVPHGDERRFSDRQRNVTAVARLDGAVAAHMIAVAMRVNEPGKRRIADALRRCQECERERRMAYIPRVDQHVAVAALEQNIVRRQPVANEDVELRQPIKHHSL